MNANFANRTSLRSRRGITLVELMVSSFILLTVVGITMSGMVFYARVAKGLVSHQRMQQQISMYLQTMTNEMIQAKEIEFIDGTRFRTKRPTYDANGIENGIITREYRYEDLDGKPETIGGDGTKNRIVYVEDPTDAAADTQELLMDWVSPVDNKTPIFAQINQGEKTYVRVTMRIGDRDNTTTNADWDRFTGPGYQSFFVQSALISNNFFVGKDD